MGLLVRMRYRKVRRIRRIEEEFEDKMKRVALPSDRISARVGEGVSRQVPERNPKS